jgi:hypothetical protein
MTGFNRQEVLMQQPVRVDWRMLRKLLYGFAHFSAIFLFTTLVSASLRAQEAGAGGVRPNSSPKPQVYGQPLAGHGPDCTCRAQGIEVLVGQSICMRLPEGGRIATCGMVLNNTSWQIGQAGCPDV